VVDRRGHRGERVTDRVRAASEFDRAAYDRLKLPRRLGESIAAWDDPAFVAAIEAGFMRPDDYVLGVSVDGSPRAYPLWLIDYYHVVNDRVGGRAFFVTSCERCGSGSAFWAEAPGAQERDPLFRAGGLLNAALMLRDVRSGSHWIHYEGRGLDRRAAGLRLPSIPVYHMEWADWCAMHPDTEVWVPPVDPRHPDARHGHGREEFFGRPGMEAAILETMTRPLDERYPENEMVLGIDDEVDPRAYPLREVHRAGGVVAESSPDGALVVFAGPRPDGITMAAFRAVVEGRRLSFRRVDGYFVDGDTASLWSIEGEAVEGELAGLRLTPVRSFYVRWQSWAAWHPRTTLFRSDREPPRYGEHPSDADTADVEPVLAPLAAAGVEIRIVGPVVSQRRPRRSRYSVAVLMNDDPVIVHAFASETAARDFEVLRAAWSALPLRTRVLESRVRRIGRHVLEASPERRYADPAQIVPAPWNEIDWPAVLDHPALGAAATEAADAAAPAEVGLTDVVRSLRLAGFDVVDLGLLPPGQLRVGAVDGIALTIEADRFLLYLFENESTAAAYAAEEPHARAFGSFVVRSTPDTMYVHQLYEIMYAGDDRIAWSPLLEDRRFAGVMDSATGRREQLKSAAGRVDVA
jgi:hypothetical protein